MKINLIPITEYAEMHGKSAVTIRQKCQRGGFRTAVKIGRNWLIDKDEPYTDNRENGKSKRWDKDNDI